MQLNIQREKEGQLRHTFQVLKIQSNPLAVSTVLIRCSKDNIKNNLQLY